MAVIMNKLCLEFQQISDSVKILINKTLEVQPKDFIKDLESLL